MFIIFYILYKIWTFQDTRHLYDQLPEKSKCGYFQIKQYGHRDFINSKDVDVVYFGQLLNVIEKMDNNKCDFNIWIIKKNWLWFQFFSFACTKLHQNIYDKKYKEPMENSIWYQWYIILLDEEFELIIL